MDVWERVCVWVYEEDLERAVGALGDPPGSNSTRDAKRAAVLPARAVLCAGATRFMELERAVNVEYRPLMLQALEVNAERRRRPSRGKSEVLYALDQPRRRFKLQAILRDTSAGLERKL